MSMNGKKITLAGILLSAVMGLSNGYAADPETIHEAGPIRYVSGGTGEPSMARMNAREGNFNFKLLMAETGGAYLSDVNVTVKQSGKTLFSTQTEGPVLLAKLPSGKYTVIAESAGKTQHKDFTVPAHGTARVDLRWPSGQ